MSTWLRVLLPLALLLLAACGVTSEHPLSDDETSVVDPALLGRWQVRPEADEEVAQDEAPQQLWVGRRKDTKNTLEVVGLEMDDDGHVEVRRLRVYATTVGEHRCLSVTGEEDGEAFLLVRYTIEDGLVLTATVLDAEVVAEAIRAKELAGTVSEPDAEDEVPDEVDVRVTADTASLRAWIEKNAGRAFDEENPLVLEKLEGPPR